MRNLLSIYGWNIEWWGLDCQSWNWGWSHRWARGIDIGPFRIANYNTEN